MKARQEDDDIGRFGRWAKSYDGSILQRLLFAPVQGFTLDEVVGLLPDPRAVLDVGCGTGALLHRVARRFPSSKLAGVDAAEEMIRVAQSSVPEGAPVYFAHGFAEQLPFPAASFDLVLTTMSFHHWADQAKALREVRRVLVPGGVFALADAMLVGPLRWLFARSFGGRFNEPSTLNGMLQDAGLHVAKIVPVPRFCGTLQVALARAAAVRIPGSRQPS